MEAKHLTEQEIANAAEALGQDCYRDIDPRLKKHLSKCDQCIQEVLVISELIDTKATPSTKRKKSSPSSPFRRKIAKGVSVAACIALIVGAYMLRPENKSDELIAEAQPKVSTIAPLLVERTKTIEATPPIDKVEPKSITKVKSDTKLLAYAPNEKMEMLVSRFENSNVRSATTSITPLTVTKGTINNITLNWKNTSKKDFTVEIFNNLGVSLIETSSTGSILKPKLKELGLYYWKIYNEDFDLLFCGKIIVE